MAGLGPAGRWDGDGCPLRRSMGAGSFTDDIELVGAHLIQLPTSWAYRINTRFRLPHN